MRDSGTNVNLAATNKYFQITIGGTDTIIHLQGDTVINKPYIGTGYITGWCQSAKERFYLIGVNTSNNIHMGDYNGANIMPVYIHAEGTQYDLCEAVFRTHTTNVANLGDGSHLWKQLFAKTATISTSDKNLKKNMKKIDSKKLQLLLNIIPKEFMFKDGDRTHMGLVAQDVENEMNKLGLTFTDIAGLCKDILYDYDIAEDGIEIESSKRPKLDKNGNPMYRYGFRYEELITPILALVQILWKQVFGDLTIVE